MPKLPNPVIVLPGVTASHLDDHYQLPPETVWSVLGKDYARSSLHPDDIRYEALEPARVLPARIFEIAYRELVEELRHNLRAKEDQPVPVFPFAYDWRQPLDSIEAELDRFVEEVIARTLLLRHYVKDGYGQAPQVNLIGHSMGGLIIAGYLKTFGAKNRVGKVATLAAPFRGSFEAIIKVTTGTANLGVDPPSSREREAARVTPALYHLLPSFKQGIDIDPTLPQSLFDPTVWQPSVVNSIEEYIRLHGIDPANKKEQAALLFASLLMRARDHREKLESFRLSDAKLVKADWLCVVGVDAETRVRVEVQKRGPVPDFAFRTKDRMNEWPSQDQQNRVKTGDGTVPFLGAEPGFLDRANLVCVTPDDYGYWEVQDRLVTKVAGFHAILPNMDMLHRLVVRHFTGRPDKHGNTWGRPAPGVDKWDPPIAGLTNKP